MTRERRTSATDRTAARKPKSFLGIASDLIFGRYISSDFFLHNWLIVAFFVIIVLAYITNKYSVQTKMEEVRRLNRQLEIVETERVRMRSMYMGRIRESSMQQLVDSLHLGLSVREQPPFLLPSD